MIFSIGLVASSCGFSKENNQNFDVESRNVFNAAITREKVEKCKFEQGYIDFCSDDYLRIYTNKDVIGVETGAAFKNVIAIGAGAPS